jgi:hypothetical protein
MITNPVKIRYPYKDEMLSALELIKLLGFDLPSVQMGTMANRMRYHCKHRGVERAMVIMADANPPLNRNDRKAIEDLNYDMSNSYGMSEDFEPFDPDLEMSRRIENMRKQHIPDNEIFIKLKHVASM